MNGKHAVLSETILLGVGLRREGCSLNLQVRQSPALSSNPESSRRRADRINDVFVQAGLSDAFVLALVQPMESSADGSKPCSSLRIDIHGAIAVRKQTLGGGIRQKNAIAKPFNTAVASNP